MSYEFTKLSDVPVVDEFPEGANAIIETNGEIKRCPSSGGGGVEFITVTQDGDIITASKNSEEILALIDSGKLPMLILPQEAVSTALGVSSEIYGFPFVRDAAQITSSTGVAFFIADGFAVVDSTGVVTFGRF